LSLYERYVLPHVIEFACSSAVARQQRAKVVGKASGVVLEPGFGGGLNLPFYDCSRVSRVIGVDPSPQLARRAEERARHAGFCVDLHCTSATQDLVAPASVDTVVLTYTLCSVSDPGAVLAAAGRALKPSGRVLFCEHAAAPEAPVRRWQERIEPIWKGLAGGCHLTRSAVAALRQAGFEIEELDEHYAENMPRFAGFHEVGVARAREESEATIKGRF